METGFFTHPDCSRHFMGDGHPESPQRLETIEDALKEEKVDDFLLKFTAPEASRKDALLVHSKEYLDYLDSHLPREGFVHLDMDTVMNPFTLKAAYGAVGAVTSAVDMSLEGKLKRAFCNVRPPGHHAERDRAMGFCFLNNIAIGVSRALKHPNIHRVAIIDFDVHRGNGTEKIFAENENVLLCSSFQYPAFPAMEIPKGNSRLINVLLPPHSSSRKFREKVEKDWVPAIESFAPDIFFISAGFDGHRNDPLAELDLNESDFAWVTDLIVHFSKIYSSERIISSLEGGYHLPSLGKSAAKHIRSLMEI